MLRPAYDEAWPEFCRESYSWDQVELWGARRDLGYSYQYRNRREWTLNAIRELAPPGGAILDVAAASGNFTLPLAEMGYHVTWNDLRSEMVDVVKLKYEFGDVKYAPGDIFGFQSDWTERFDAILACEVLEHVAHPDQFLKCLWSVLKPGGRLILTTPNGRYFRFNLPRFSECPDPSVYEAMQFMPDSNGHIFLFDEAECRMVAANAGFEVERLTLMNNALTRGHVKLGHLLPYLPESLVRAVESGTRMLPRPLRAKAHCQLVAVLRKPKA
jgi:2-polyprenyl-3-methyl-5-hydroxy-6-metoxy-1,4-benzoquinol methylase